MQQGTGRFLRRTVLLLHFLTLAGLLSLSARVPSPRAAADDAEIPDSCTSITVGRLASTDGSVMTCHTCDGNYRTWLNVVPHQKHAAGSKTKVYWGLLHTETPWDTRGKIEKGEVPQVDETYAFLNTAYPCLNEKQLGIGETTIGGRKELENDEGLFLIEELERIALERCRTARDAIRLIGKLVKEYGYGDSGECITLGDTREVWQLEIFGAGPAEKGAVWAAVRIPDDHIGVSANRPRISTLDLKDADRYMASDNVFKVAEEMGWWDPKKGEPFRFWKAYSTAKPYSDREYFIFNALAPSLKLSKEAEELPFTVKPEKKLAVREILAMYRQTYEGTEFDMTRNLMVPRMRRPGPDGDRKDEPPAEKVKSPVVSNFMNYQMIALLNALKPGTVESRRTIAISGCSYSQIIQLRGWLPDDVGGVAWFSFDNPAQSPRFPIFSGTLSLPRSFEYCAQHRFTSDSACWAFRKTNRLATVRWGDTRKQIEGAAMEFEDRAFLELPDVEKKYEELAKSGDATKAREYLTKYTNDFARAAIDKWGELEGVVWMMLGGR